MSCLCLLHTVIIPRAGHENAMIIPSRKRKGLTDKPPVYNRHMMSRNVEITDLNRDSHGIFRTRPEFILYCAN